MTEEVPHNEADRLYWETDISVAEIANGLEISRRALYDAIEPRPTGTPCPECGTGLVFRNRTSAERGQAECLECGTEVSLERIGDADDEAPEAEQERVAAHAAPVPRPPVGSGPILSGTLLAGLALGAVAGYLIRRR